MYIRTYMPQHTYIIHIFNLLRFWGYKGRVKDHKPIIWETLSSWSHTSPTHPTSPHPIPIPPHPMHVHTQVQLYLHLSYNQITLCISILPITGPEQALFDRYGHQHTENWDGYSIVRLVTCNILACIVSLYVLIALSLLHAIPFKAPWIVSTSDSEYLFCLTLVRDTCYKVAQCRHGDSGQQLVGFRTISFCC